VFLPQPPPLIACALMSSSAMMVLLWVLRLRNPGGRFKAAATAGLALLLGSSAVAFVKGYAVEPADACAAMLILGAGGIIAFILWSLIAWGFTLNMLLELTSANTPVDLLQWADRYAHQDGLRRFTADRLGVLLAVGLVTKSGDGHYRATLTGGSTAIILGYVCKIFGITK
jgi:hypothetical protein